MIKKNHSEKTKLKIGLALKGIPKSDEHKRKLSLANKKQIPWSKGLTKETDNRIKKMSEIRKKLFKEGKIFINHSKENKLKISKTNKIVMNRPEIKEKIRIARSTQILPLKDTKIEIKIQNFLKILEIEYFTHQYIKNIEHKYQCDILIPSINMVIECDGDYWHKYPTGNDIDHIRTRELLEKGFKVLRLWECEIKNMNINSFKIIFKNKKEVVEMGKLAK